ncbi:MAG: radical SAM protein [Candidatus Brocadiaceae bacterium]|nr:radical SAM protein [Candidatus Brocadiaceae bacterium]
MNVLFANLPTFENSGNFNRPIRFPTYNYATPVMHPPLLLAYAASYVRARGHKVDLIDAQVESVSVGDFIERAKGLCPDFLVCETSTPSFTSDARVIDLVKKEIPGLKVVFLGPHVTALPEESLRGTSIDCVVMGEYEESLLEYVEKGPKETKGIAYRVNGHVVRNAFRDYISDLDSLPFPVRDLLPNYRYFDPILRNPFTFMLGGRGCPYRCIFCNWPQTISGRRYRVRTVRNIVDEIGHLLENYEFKSILFNDDTFTANKQHAIAVCDEILRRGLKFDWACYARADTDDEELLRKLRKAGCYLLKVGVESSNQAILDGVKKGYKVENIRRGIKRMLEECFHVHATFVIGLPGETKETIQETVNFAIELSPTTVQFSSAIPYPGTEFYELLDRNGDIIAKDWEEFMPLRPVFRYQSLSSEELINSVKQAYRQYYLRPRYVKIALKEMLTQPRILVGNARKLLQLVW